MGAEQAEEEVLAVERAVVVKQAAQVVVRAVVVRKAAQAVKGRMKWTRRLETAGIRVHTEAKIDPDTFHRTECRATPQHGTG